MYDRRVHLKVKIKHLAAEAKIIRHEIAKAKAKRDPHLCATLNSHRVLTVRYAARHAQLAYACLRGVPYSAIEAKCYEEPNWTEIRRQALAFGPVYNFFDFGERYSDYVERERIYKDRVDRWLQDARHSNKFGVQK